MRSTIISLAACIGFALAAYADEVDSQAPVAEDAKPDAVVTLSGGSVAAGIGYTWGRGELAYQDRTYQFSIKGLSIVDVGASNYTATGNVYNLKKLADFSGNYTAVGAGFTIAGGGTGVYLRNDHGVVVKVRGKDVGLKFKLSAEGVRVALKE